MMFIIVDKMPESPTECMLAHVNFEDQERWICSISEPACKDRTCCLVDHENCPYLRDLPTAIVESGLIDAASYNTAALGNVIQEAMLEAEREDGEHNV